MIRIILTAAAVASATWSSCALAQSFDPFDAASRAIDRACYARSGQEIETKRLAEAIALESFSGLPGDETVEAVSNPDLLLERAGDRRLRLAATKSVVLQELANDGSAMAKSLAVSPRPPKSGTTTVDWLFVSGSSFRLKCSPEKPPKPAQFASLQPLVVRKVAGDLAKIGDERKAAGSAQVTFDDLRSTNLAGQEKETRKLIVNAAIGLTLAGNEDRNILAYGEYSRSRVRIETSPTPIDPAKNGSADDIDALELGFLGTTRVADAFRVSGRGGIILDSITDARYLAGTLSIVPITGGKPNLGFCNFNSFRYIGGGIEGMCTASLEGDWRYVVRSGTATITEKDAIVAVGPSLGLAFRRSLDASGKPRDGLVGSITYKYLPVIAGTGPDLDRFDASLVYRWWVDDLGLDLGLTYSDGIERKSLSDEHRFGFTFGIIF